MMEFTSELHAHIDAFEVQVSTRYSKVQDLDLLVFWKEMTTLCIDIYSLIKSQVSVTLPIIPLFTKSLPLK